MSTRRRRRNYVSAGSGGGGGTTYTNQIHITTGAQGARVTANAAFDDLAQFTVALLIAINSTDTGVFCSKGDVETTGWRTNQAADQLIDFSSSRSTTPDFKRAAGPPADGTYYWLFTSHDRTAHTGSRAFGPHGGTIDDIFRDAALGGVGTYPAENGDFLVGVDGTGPGGAIMDVRFVAYCSGLLTLTQMRAIAADALSQTALMIDYWKPSVIGGSGTVITSGKGALGSMTTIGASVT